MKKIYTKPMLAVERYELTQTVATCTGMKIGFFDSQCVKNDPDAPDLMKDLAYSGFFASSTVSAKRGCDMVGTGMEEYDGICYHTSVNAAFTS